MGVERLNVVLDTKTHGQDSLLVEDGCAHVIGRSAARLSNDERAARKAARCRSVPRWGYVRPD